MAYRRYQFQCHALGGVHQILMRPVAMQGDLTMKVRPGFGHMPMQGDLTMKIQPCFEQVPMRVLTSTKRPE